MGTVLCGYSRSPRRESFQPSTGLDGVRILYFLKNKIDYGYLVLGCYDDPRRARTTIVYINICINSNKFSS
eukprot:SAG31_NODE_567_length_14028_cov_4.022328_6_plen_71_part_00